MSRAEYVQHTFVFQCVVKGCHAEHITELEGNWSGEAEKAARKDGWRIDDEEDAAFAELCPEHACGHAEVCLGEDERR